MDAADKEEWIAERSAIIQEGEKITFQPWADRRAIECWESTYGGDGQGRLFG